MDVTGIKDYKTLVSDIIQKQITIFGPVIALMKLRQIPDLNIDDDGTISNLPPDPRTIIKPLIDQFSSLSPSIVKKTMKPLILLTESIADLKEEEKKEIAVVQTTDLT